MDECGIYRNKLVDWDEIKRRLKKDRSIVFSYSCDAFGIEIVYISEQYEVIGPMLFGGNPALLNHAFISVLRRGCYHFPKEPVNASEFRDKLNLPIPESEWIEELWRAIYG